MKKLYATLLLAMMATAGFAQINLQTTMMNPTAGQGVTVGTAFPFKVEFKNLGTATIMPTDTLLYTFTGAGSTVYFRTGLTKAPNDTIFINTTLTFSAAQNGPLNFCVLGYIFRNGQRLESDTTNNQSCKSIVISGGTTNGIATVFSNENTINQTLNVVPNPATNEVRLGFTVVNNGNATARVLDVTGREVIRQDYGMQYRGANEFRLDVSKLMPGMYMVEMIQNNVRAVGRMVRQ